MGTLSRPKRPPKIAITPGNLLQRRREGTDRRKIKMQPGNLATAAAALHSHSRSLAMAMWGIIEKTNKASAICEVL